VIVKLAGRSAAFVATHRMPTLDRLKPVPSVQACDRRRRTYALVELEQALTAAMRRSDAEVK
jgi:hypothetical protein